MSTHGLTDGLRAAAADLPPDPDGVYEVVVNAARGRRRRRRLATAIPLLAAVAVLAFAFVGINRSGGRHLLVSGAGAVSSSTSSSPAPASKSISVVASLGANNNLTVPTGFVGDATSAGVWLWTSNVSGSELDHWDDARRTLDRYPIGNTEADIVPGNGASVAVARNGSAWIAQNRDLIRVDLHDKNMKAFTVPVTTTNTKMESFRPSEARGEHAAVAVAVSADGGTVAVAVDATSAVAVFDTATQTFSQLHLPPTEDATGLSFFPDGRLVVGIADYTTGHTEQLLVWNRDRTSFTGVAVPDSSAVSAGLDGSVVSGHEDPSIVTGDLSVSTISAAATHPGDLYVGPTVVLRDGTRASASSKALIIANAAGGDVRTIAYPAETCPAAYPSPAIRATESTSTQPGPTSTPSETTTCVRQPVVVAADGAGNVWMEFQLSAGLALAVVRPA